jgi:hypothetical protein
MSPVADIIVSQGLVWFVPTSDFCTPTTGVAIRLPANASDAPFDATFMKAGARADGKGKGNREHTVSSDGLVERLGLA